MTKEEFKKFKIEEDSKILGYIIPVITDDIPLTMELISFKDSELEKYIPFFDFHPEFSHALKLNTPILESIEFINVNFPNIINHIKPRYDRGNHYAGRFMFQSNLIKPLKKFNFKLVRTIDNLQLSSHIYEVETMLINDNELAYLHLN